MGQAANPDHPTAGFALIDTLVAMLILAIIAGLMTMFVTQFQAVKRTEDRARMAAELGAASRFLETTLASALPLPFVGDTNRFVLIGGADRVRLVARVPRGFRIASLSEIELGPVSPASGLALRARPRRAGTEDGAAAPSETAINAAVTAVTFSYLGADGVWTEAWEKRELPIAIRFRLVAERRTGGTDTTGMAVLRLAKLQAAQDD